MTGFLFVFFPSSHQEIKSTSYERQNSNANNERHSNNNRVLRVTGHAVRRNLILGGGLEYFLVAVGACVKNGKRTFARNKIVENVVSFSLNVIVILIMMMTAIFIMIVIRHQD